jgi:SanA protein
VPGKNSNTVNSQRGKTHRSVQDRGSAGSLLRLYARFSVRVLKYAFIAGVLIAAFIDMFITQNAGAYMFTRLDEVPPNELGLLLGTSMYLSSGEPNPYFEKRITAAADLYHAGRIQRILASGDHRETYYNEPADMKNALISLGVPDHDIYIDNAGLSTLDSVLRASKVFGFSSYTVISQRFHNERAIYIAHHYDIDAVGFNASDVGTVWGIRTVLREYLARIKAVLDLQIRGVEPEYQDLKKQEGGFHGI